MFHSRGTIKFGTEFFEKHAVAANHVKTAWGDVSIVKAQNELLRTFLQKTRPSGTTDDDDDAYDDYAVLVSGQCIPVKAFETSLERVSKLAGGSWFCAFNQSSRFPRFDSVVDKCNGPSREQVALHHQWSVLSFEDARAIVDNSDRIVSWYEHTRAPDESAWATALRVFGRGDRSAFSRGVHEAPCVVQWADVDQHPYKCEPKHRGNAHPTTYRFVTRRELEFVSRHCQAITARKFVADCRLVDEAGFDIGRLLDGLVELGVVRPADVDLMSEWRCLAVSREAAESHEQRFLTSVFQTSKTSRPTELPFQHEVVSVASCRDAVDAFLAAAERALCKRSPAFVWFVDPDPSVWRDQTCKLDLRRLVGQCRRTATACHVGRDQRGSVMRVLSGEENIPTHCYDTTFAPDARYGCSVSCDWIRSRMWTLRTFGARLVGSLKENEAIAALVAMSIVLAGDARWFVVPCYPIDAHGRLSSNARAKEDKVDAGADDQKVNEALVRLASLGYNHPRVELPPRSCVFDLAVPVSLTNGSVGVPCFPPVGLAVRVRGAVFALAIAFASEAPATFEFVVADHGRPMASTRKIDLTVWFTGLEPTYLESGNSLRTQMIKRVSLHRCEGMTAVKPVSPTDGCDSPVDFFDGVAERRTFCSLEPGVYRLVGSLPFPVVSKAERVRTRLQLLGYESEPSRDDRVLGR